MRKWIAVWALLIGIPISLAWAANTKLSSLGSASAITGANRFYCVQSDGSGGVSCIASQIATYINSLFSGDFTASSGGVATLKNTGPGATGPIGSPTVAPVVTIDAQGRVTALTSANISGAVLPHPIVQSGFWTPPFYRQTVGAAATLNVIKCYPEPVFDKMTVDNVGVRITTLAGAGNIQAALYKDSGGRPGALISNTGSQTTAATGAFSMALGASQQIGPGGTAAGNLIWKCFNSDNSTVVLSAIDVNGGPVANFIGSATLINTLGNASVIAGIDCTTTNCAGGSSTFPGGSSWPATLAGTIWNQDVTNGSMPAISLHAASVPCRRRRRSRRVTVRRRGPSRRTQVAA